MYGCESWNIKKAGGEKKERKLSAKELTILNCGVGEDSWESWRSNQSILKIIPGCSLEGLMLKLKLQYLATWWEELTHLKWPWCWERLRAGGEGEDRGRNGCMASLTQWTWVKIESGSWWWTGRPGVLWFMGSERVTQDWVTELNWTAFSKSVLNICKFTFHVLLKPGLENFDHYFTSVWDEFNCAVVWTFFGIAFLWCWNENWPFPVLWPLPSFPDLLA